MVCAMVGAGDDVIHPEGRKQGREEGLISRFRREGRGQGAVAEMIHSARDLSDLKSSRVSARDVSLEHSGWW